jgi:hypothetical protein
VTVDPELKARLKAWTSADIWAPDGDLRYTLVELADSGEEGAELLAEEFRTRTKLQERIALIGALGGASGPAGLAEIREAAKTTGPGTAELRSTALWSLASRLHGEATGDLVEALTDRVGSVGQSAMYGLSAYGTADAWEPVFALLPKWLKSYPKRDGPFPEGLFYLQIHADIEQLVRLDQLLNEHRELMAVHAVLDRICPVLGEYTQEDLPQLLRARAIRQRPLSPIAWPT